MDLRIGEVLMVPWNPSVASLWSLDHFPPSFYYPFSSLLCLFFDNFQHLSAGHFIVGLPLLECFADYVVAGAGKTVLA